DQRAIWLAGLRGDFPTRQHRLRGRGDFPTQLAAYLRNRLVVDLGSFRDLAIGPPGPLGITQQPLDGTPLVGLRPLKAVCCVCPDTAEDRVAPRALPDRGFDGLALDLASRLDAVIAVAEPIGRSVAIENDWREVRSAEHLLGVVVHRLGADLGAHLGACVLNLRKRDRSHSAAP